eukprot:CAMPEP_0170484330 /NCGR_PEP_ID=MMETSP0208-20121228/3821_1 /TAXON_ID=197538 /ORGANISM="Strombidium inclinatum, Strain S3" /LENGTH=89 /DNA_ID=CAMNT_0010757637 /DNA_START=235 /DNA_END=504 /DNA_ORIENTATION=+
MVQGIPGNESVQEEGAVDYSPAADEHHSPFKIVANTHNSEEENVTDSAEEEEETRDIPMIYTSPFAASREAREAPSCDKEGEASHLEKA